MTSRALCQRMQEFRKDDKSIKRSLRTFFTILTPALSIYFKMLPFVLYRKCSIIFHFEVFFMRKRQNSVKLFHVQPKKNKNPKSIKWQLRRRGEGFTFLKINPEMIFLSHFHFYEAHKSFKRQQVCTISNE